MGSVECLPGDVILNYESAVVVEDYDVCRGSQPGTGKFCKSVVRGSNVDHA